MKKIKLTMEYETLIDDKNFDYFNQWKWYAHKEGRGTDIYVYAIRSENGKSIRMHNEIMGVTSKKVIVDHKDGNGLNNQEKNLRITNKSGNCKNRKGKNSNNTSGYRNVSWIDGFWRIQLQIKGKNKLFPEKFENVDDAGIFAKKMRDEYYGDFAGKNE
jgi:hypothetical protein